MYRIKLTQEELEHIIDVLWDVDKFHWSKESRELNKKIDKYLNVQFHLQK